jgi:hypothetical protein
VRIDKSLLHFCAQKTAEIAADYDKYCTFPEERETGGFPRSADDLGMMIAGDTGKHIIYRQLKIQASEAKFRAFSLPFDDRYEIYFASGLSLNHMRYLKVKELMQIRLYQSPSEHTMLWNLYQT